MPTSSIKLERQASCDAAVLLYGNAYAGIGISIFAATLLVFGFENTLTKDFKIAWWMAMFALLLFRLADVIYWDTRLRKLNYDGKRYIRRYIGGVWLTAVMWCVYSLSTFSNATSTELTSILIIMAAMAGGGATVLNAHMLTACGYALLLVGPLSIMLLLSGDEGHDVLGLLALTFCLVMVVTARKAASFTAEAIRKNNQNAILVNEMEEAVEERTRQIYELSNLDPLTGLFNRSAFSKHLDDEIQRSVDNGSSLALLFIDLDGFKRINDAIGHETGDRILKLTAARLESCAPEKRLLCRWGGDEFLMTLPETTDVEAQEIAREIIRQISLAHVFDNNRLSISATIGIAMYPDHARSATELVRLADTAMYFQKKQSQSSIKVFSKDLSVELYREQYLRDGLADAIYKQQLSMVFQPLICSDSGNVFAMEALMRWNNGQEVIPPNEFIPVAEQYGLIRKIGAWALDEACRAASTWEDELEIAVCVNVSVSQIMEEDFIEIVDSALQRNQLSGTYLHIEITESIFASDKTILLKQVNALHERGIKVSIDDFGTGYSSLSVMQDLAADIVKIDKSFVDSLDSKGMEVIRAILQMAKSLGCQVVAEGVETREQAVELANLGVDIQQGFYFARPLDEADVCDYLTHCRKNRLALVG